MLENYVRKEILFEKGELVLRNPNKREREALKEKIHKLSIESDGENAELVVGMETLKYIIRMFTTIGEEIDEYDDDAIEELLDGNDDLASMVDRIMDLIVSIQNEIFRETIQKAREVRMKLNAGKITSEYLSLRTELENKLREIDESLGLKEKEELKKIFKK